VSDLSLVKSVAIVNDTFPAGSINAGDTVRFTVTVSNAGPNTATGVAVRDAVPSGYSSVTNISNGGTFSAGNVDWTSLTIPVGGSVALTFDALVLASGSYTNYAQVQASDNFDPDSTPGDNSTNQDDDDTLTPVVVPVSDLGLVKSVGFVTDTVPLGVYNAGDVVQFTVTVSNAGPNTATGVAVRDAVPSGYTSVGSISHGGTLSGGNVDWTGLTVPVGGNVALTFQATLAATGSYTNYAQVMASDNPDPDSTPGNNSTTEDDDDTLTPNVVPVSDLSLVKSVAIVNDTFPAGSINAGDTVRFTVTVSNAGPNTATGVAVRDAVPSGYSSVTNISNGGTFSAGNVDWTSLTIPVGGSVALTFDALVLASGSYTNYAQVQASDNFDPDSTPGDNSTNQDDDDTLTPVVVPVSDLGLVKSVGFVTDTVPLGVYNAGDVVQFTVTVSNAGPNTATGVAVRDAVPSGYTSVGSISHGGTLSGGNVDWTGLTIPVGGNVALTFQATLAATGSYTNYAQVMASDNPDPDSTPGNNSTTEDDDDTLTPNVVPVSDLSLVKSVAIVNDTFPAGSINAGDTVRFTVTVSNAGPNTATGVAVRDAVPSGYSSVTNISNGGTFSAGNVDWTSLTIPVGGSVALTFDALVLASGSYTNYAQVQASDNFDPDSTPGDNSTNQDDDDTLTPVVVPVSDLGLVKSVGFVTDTVPLGVYNAGDVVQFTVTVSNAGPNTATGVAVRDAVPSGYTSVGSISHGGTLSGGNVDWTGLTIPVGGNVALTFQATLAATGSYTNYAQVMASDNPDPDSTPGNNSTTEDDDDTLTPNVVPVSDLSLVKSVAIVNDTFPAGSINAGDTVRFTVTVSNAGPNTATGVAVRDAVPSGYSSVTNISNGGTFSAGNVDWTSLTIPVGGSVALTFDALVLASGSYTNYAQVQASDNFDPDSTPGDNSTNQDDDDTLTPVVVPVSDLGLVKSVGFVTDTVPLGVYNAGDVVQFTVTVSNAGPNTATGVAVRDAVPSGYTSVGSISHGGTLSGGNVDWTGLTIPVGGNVALTFQATLAATGSYTNYAQVMASDNPDPDSTPGNNSTTEDDDDTLTPNVVPVSDLSLVKSVAIVNDTFPAGSINAGDTVRFTVTVSNAGPNTATGVAVRDAVPSGYSSVTNISNGGTFSAGNVDWTSLTIPVGGSVALTFDALVLASGSYTNYAQVQASDNFDPDSTPGDNSTNQDDDDTLTPVVVPVSDLGLVKSVGFVTDTVPLGVYNAGDVVQFTVTVSNAGPNTATGVAVRDAVPSGYTSVGSISHGGTLSGGNVDWTGLTIPVGGNVALTFQATLAATGSYTNYAQVMASDNPDPDSTPGNNSTTEDDDDTLTPNVVPVSDLSLVKSVAIVNDTFPAGSINAGDTVRFTVTVSNAGPNTATGVAVRDAVPSGYSSVTNISNGGTFSAGNVDWTSLTIPVGGSVALTFDALVLASGSYTNYAQVQASDNFDPDSTPGDNSTNQDDDDTLTPVVVPVSDLGLVKSVGFVTDTVPLGVYNAGDVVQFTVTVSNAGPNTATGVAVRDAVPSGYTSVGSISHGGTLSGGNVDWTGLTIPVGGNVALTFQATLAATGSYTNYAQVMASDNPDPDSTPGNNSTTEDDDDTLTPNVVPVSDLSLVKSVAIVNDTFPAGSINAGDTVRFTVTVSNAGPNTATGVAVRDAVPSGYSSVTNISNGGTFSAGNVDWTSLTIPVGGSVALTFDALVLASGSYTNYAQVQASDNFDPDSTPGDNSTNQDDDDTLTPVVVPVSDLGLVKSVGFVTDTVPLGVYNAGDVVQFTVTVSNAGPNTATGVAVRDAVPSGYTSVGSISHGGTLSGGNVDWTGLTIPVGGNVALTFQATLAATGSYTNYAQVMASDNPDPDSTPGNNSTTEDDDDTLTPNVVPVSDLSLVKSVAIVNDTFPAGSINAGDTVRFTVTVSNAGPNTATGVAVRDAVPSGYSSVTNISNGGTFSAGNVDWTSLTIPVGGSVALTFDALVLASGSYTNYAQVQASDNFDPDSTPGDNSTNQDDDDTLTPVVVPVSDLSLVKSVGFVTDTVPLGVYNAGDVVQFTVTVSNAGPNTATGVAVRDAVPSGYTSVGSISHGGTLSGGNVDWTGLTIPVGGNVALTFQATLAATGSYTNYAQVMASDNPDPDSTPGNNSTTEDDDDTLTPNVVPVADLQITKTDGRSFDVPGTTATYTIVVSNAGPSSVTGATVSDPFPAVLTGVTYTAVGTGGASGFPSSGSGNINHTVNMPAGSTITYTATGLISQTATGTLSNTATVTVPPGVTDPDTGNNSSTDTTTLLPVNGSIGQRIFFDTNNDGTYDAGEGLAGVVVTLVADFDGDGILETRQTTTDANGFYTFNFLPTNNGSGGGITYTITVDPTTLPAGLIATVDPDGVFDGTTLVTLTDGAPNNAITDFGYRNDPDQEPTTIGNDQDGMFTTVGDWYELVPCVGNYNDDVSYAPAGNGSSVGTWRFTGLTPGVYRVSVTWETLLGSPRASNAPFTVRGNSGETPITTRINQTLTPGDFPGAVYDNGFYWVDVASNFQLDGFNLFVDLSNDADNYVVADAVRVQRVMSPEIAVNDSGTDILDNTGIVSFGVTQLGSPITKTFTVQNVGGSDLVLTGPITVPTGFTVVSSFGSTTLNPGQSTTFQVRYDAQSLGLASGMLSFGTNDSDENPFNFTISAEAAGTIVDDGDPGFATSGAWTTFSTGGYGGDLRYALSGSGTSVATWTIGGLTPGQTYQVGATWLEGTNRATNAAYQVYNGSVSPGNLAATTTVNQQLAPNDFTSVGVGWNQLAIVTPSGSSITVRLDNNANGYVIADAVQARPIDAPQAVVTSDGTPITYNTGSADFGVTSIGADVTKTITVQNQGTQPLTLGTVSVNCPDFTVTQFGQTTLNPGQSTTFSVTMLAGAGGTFSGSVSFATNDPAKNPFVFQLAGEVTSSAGSPWIIDNGDAGYWTSCCWTDYSGLGYGGDLQYAASGNGSIVADWTFTGLTPGQAYELATTWTTHTNRATNAPYSLYNGSASSGNLVSSTAVNQQVAPNDFSDSGAWWERIGVLTPTGSTVTVRLSNLANGYVIADAVRIAPTTVVAAPEIAVSVDGNNLPDGTGSVAFGTTTAGTPVTKTFTVQNVGAADLTLGAISVPSGFTYTTFGTTTVAPGGSTTFTVTMTAASAGTYSGTVSFVNNDADENPFDFTVSGTVSTVSAPEIAVSVDGNNLPDGTGSVAFGTTTAGTPVAKTFTVQNVGTADLTLGVITVPAGFTASTFGTTTVSAGGSTTFTVTMTAASAGSYSGTVSFVNNDADENPFDFSVSGTVNAPAGVVLIMDDGDPGYSKTGSWSYATGSGYNSDFETTPRGNGSRKATWEFTGLDVGTYLVSTTWVPASTRASNAPYRTYNGVATSGNLMNTVAINQRVQPDDFSAAGANWENLGVFTITGSTLTIVLGNDANATVLADAVRIERVSPLRAEGGIGSTAGETAGLTQQQADAAFAAAATVWASAGVTQSEYQMLQSMPVRVMDLPGDMLGGATSVGVFVDWNAAGYGWSVDMSALSTTPGRPAIRDRARSGWAAWIC
jgi:uncharacterized repeat protein (TIGR01451 family)